MTWGVWRGTGSEVDGVASRPPLFGGTQFRLRYHGLQSGARKLSFLWPGVGGSPPPGAKGTRCGRQ